jgi:hypothetical protein
MAASANVAYLIRGHCSGEPRPISCLMWLAGRALVYYFFKLDVLFLFGVYLDWRRFFSWDFIFFKNGANTRMGTQPQRLRQHRRSRPVGVGAPCPVPGLQRRPRQGGAVKKKKKKRMEQICGNHMISGLVKQSSPRPIGFLLALLVPPANMG